MFHVFILLDEFITNKLTTFCWWSELYLKKDNVWWSKITLAVIFPVVITPVVFFEEGLKEEDYISFLLGSFFGAFLCGWFTTYVFKKYSGSVRIVRDARKSPNKNKKAFVIIIAKASLIGNNILSIVSLHAVLFPWGETSELLNFVMSTVLLLFVYFLCTEPIPPSIKKQKEEEISQKRLQFVPQKN